MKKIIVLFLLFLAGNIFAQDVALNSASVIPSFNRSATCASPDNVDHIIAAPPADYNYLNNNGYCYTVSPAVKDFVGCYTFTAGATSVDLNAGYNATGCNGGLNINYAILYTSGSCVVVDNSAIGVSTGLVIGASYTWCISLKCTGGGPGFSTFCPYYQNISPLPIELVFFNGNKGPLGNILTWATASETNNDYFNLERSSDAMNWEDIKMIDGAGSSTSYLYYYYIDTEPINGLNYYRLKQTDFNGQMTYSNMVALDNSDDIIKIIDKIYTPLGQEVSDDYEGLRIIHYTDGTVVRKVGQ